MEEREKVPMGQRELKRGHPREIVEAGKITVREAGERIDVPCHQAKRMAG